MATPTTRPLSLTILLAAGLTSCASIQAEREISASEPSAPRVCDQPARDRSYVAACVSTMSRESDTPIRDIPYSAQVITRPVIEDQKALTVGDALRNVSGVQGR